MMTLRAAVASRDQRAASHWFNSGQAILVDAMGRSGWIREAQEAYLDRSIDDLLYEWPDSDAFGLCMQPIMEELVVYVTRERFKDVSFAQMLNIRLRAPMEAFCDNNSGFDEYHDDSLGEIAFYFMQMVVWTHAQAGILVEGPPIPIEYAGDILNDLNVFDVFDVREEVVTLESDFLKAMLFSPEPLSVRRIQLQLHGHEMRVPVLLKIQAHCEQMRVELSRLLTCMVNTLSDLIQREGLMAEKTSKIPCPGPVQENWIADKILTDLLKRKLSHEVAQLEAVDESIRVIS